MCFFFYVYTKQPRKHMPSQIFNIISGVIAIFAGIYMASAKSVGANSLIESLINGIGWYCISRGMFMISSTASLSNMMSYLFEKQEAESKECNVCFSKVNKLATKCSHCGSELTQPQVTSVP